MNQDQRLIEQLDRIIDELQKVKQLNTRLSAIAKNMNFMQLEDLIHNFTRPGRIIWINLLVGLSRGLGLTLGTAIVLGLLALIAGQIIDLPIIGKYIAELVDWIDAYRSYRLK